jgi:hypothetical protein
MSVTTDDDPWIDARYICKDRRCCRATLRNEVKRGAYPKPIIIDPDTKPYPQVYRWRLSSHLAWKAEKEQTSHHLVVPGAPQPKRGRGRPRKHPAPSHVGA